MLHLYSATTLQEGGAGCDCCVAVRRCDVDVFARDEQHARELLEINSKSNHLELVILELRDLGPVEKVEKPGTKLNSWGEIFRGEQRNSPLHTRA